MQITISFQKMGAQLLLFCFTAIFCKVFPILAVQGLHFAHVVILCSFFTTLHEILFQILYKRENEGLHETMMVFVKSCNDTCYCICLLFLIWYPFMSFFLPTSCFTILLFVLTLTFLNCMYATHKTMCSFMLLIAHISMMDTIFFHSTYEGYLICCLFSYKSVMLDVYAMQYRKNIRVFQFIVVAMEMLEMYNFTCSMIRSTHLECIEDIFRKNASLSLSFASHLKSLYINYEGKLDNL